MKYLNLGCGAYYSVNTEWTNLDFVSSDKHVIAHNLLKGIPFESNTFDFVYHSHVLEHFSKDDGENFIKECHRVLKPGAAIRIAIPDLERLAKDYLKTLEAGIQDPHNELLRANYNWMVLEMYDQTMRNYRAGEIGKYLHQDQVINETFVYERVGEEGRAFRNEFLASKKTTSKATQAGFLQKLKQAVKSFIFSLFNINPKANEIGEFRLNGEIHQWMYDRYSLSYLLEKTGFEQVVIRDAFTSYVSNWADYNIDGKNGITRKPDSLFIEAKKK
ncbi:MAG: methyltransferase domain-containing protein [Chitinophagales bacterium]